MHKDEEQRQPHCCAHGRRVGDAPCYAREQHEEGEEVCEGGVGAVPRVFRLCWWVNFFRICGVEGKTRRTFLEVSNVSGWVCAFELQGGEGAVRDSI